MKFIAEESGSKKAVRWVGEWVRGNLLWVAPGVISVGLTSSLNYLVPVYGMLGLLLIHPKSREWIMKGDRLFRRYYEEFKESEKVSRALRETLKGAKLVRLDKEEKVVNGKKVIKEILTYPNCQIEKDWINYYLKFRIMPGQTESDWERRASAFSSALAGKMVDFEIDSGTVSMTIQHTRIEADKVLYKQEEGHYLNVGMGAGGIVRWNFDDDPHALIVGTTGSGKSTFVRNLLIQLDPNWDIYICDGKYVEFSFLRNYGFRVASDEESFADFIEKTYDEVLRRNREMEKAGVNDYKLMGWKPYFLIIDEFIFVADAFPADKGRGVAESPRDKMYKKLRQIALMGRACGVQLMLILQRPDANFLPTVIRDNMVLKVCLMKGRSQTALEMCFGSERAKELKALKKGMGYVETGEAFNVFGFADYKQEQFKEDLKFRHEETPPKFKVVHGSGSGEADRVEA